MAAASDGRGCIPDFSGLEFPLYTAGGAGGIILCRIRKNGQLFQQIHDSRGIAALLATAGPLQMIDQMHQIDRYGKGPQNHDYITHCCHKNIPPIEFLFDCYYISNKRFCQCYIEQIF